MKKLYFKITILLFSVLLLISCRNTQSEMAKFVIMYNNTSSYIVNDVIRATKAETVSPTEIKITIDTRISDDMQSEMTEKSFPALISSVLLKEKISSDLLDEGVNFKVNITDVNYTNITTVDINKNTIKNFTASDVSSNTSAISTVESDVNSELNEMLAILNKSLPIEDKASGFKIMKIEAGNDQDIIYYVQVPNEIAEVLKIEGADNLMKDEVLRNPELKQILQKANQYNINKLKYRMTNNKGEKLKEIVINEKDIK